MKNPYHHFTRVFLFRQTKGNTSIPQCASTVGRLLVLITTDSREHLGFRAAHVQNHVRRRKDYKTYWRALKKCGLWQDPVCLARKVELGDRIDAVRERMPKCVVKNVREGFPNPLGIPYMGHKRDWDWGKVQFFTSPYSIISILYFQNCITISTTIIIMLHNRETGDV